MLSPNAPFLSLPRVRKIIASPQQRILVALSPKNVIVGMTILTIKNLCTKTIGEIDDVSTHRDFRRRGIARRLNTLAIEIARREGCSHIDLTSSRPEAIELYGSLGYRCRNEETNLFRLSLTK